VWFEDLVADLGAADLFRWAVESAVSDHLAGARDHESRRPRAAVGSRLHPVELDGEEAVELVGGWKGARESQSLRAFSVLALALE